MIIAYFQRLTPWQRFLGWLFPAKRRARDERLRSGIQWLLKNPDVPVRFDD